jgi:mercuric ion binding protein
MNPYRVLLVVLLSLAPMVVSAATIEMHVNGLVCAFCAQGIEKKLRKFPATADVVVSLEQRLVAVALKDGQDIPDSDLRKALTNAGYTVTTIQRSDTPIDTIRSRLGQTKP